MHKTIEEAACKVSHPGEKTDLLNPHVDINAMAKAIFNEEAVLQTESMRCCYKTSLLLTRKTEHHKPNIGIVCRKSDSQSYFENFHIEKSIFTYLD